MPAARASGNSAAGVATARLFFALWPPQEVRAGLHRQARDCHATSGGRVVPIANLHVTLAFLGDVASARIGELEALGDALPGTAFELVLDRVGYWPHNRIVYAGTGQAPPALSALAVGLGRVLGQAGFRIEERPYVAHATLLRDARRAPAGAQCAPIRWQVEDYALVQSCRGRAGSAYEVLRRFTLAPAAAMLRVHSQ